MMRSIINLHVPDDLPNFVIRRDPLAGGCLVTSRTK